MLDSPIHELIAEIRRKFSGKRVSISDIRKIEEKYKLCSFVNVRNDNCAFIRITSFGCGEVTFEDLVFNIDFLKNFKSLEELMFNINKVLFGNAYDVILVDTKENLLNDPIGEPSFNFETLIEENKRLIKRCTELENKLSNEKNNQISLFDLNDF